MTSLSKISDIFSSIKLPIRIGIVAGLIITMVLTASVFNLNSGVGEVLGVSIRRVRKPDAPILTTNLMGWIYPGPPACSAISDVEKSPIFTTLKPEYLILEDNGALTTMTEGLYGCNGYSPANAQKVKSLSREQFVMISGRLDGIRALIATDAKMQSSITIITKMLQDTGFTGVELDFEDFGSWSDTDYARYKTYISKLGTALRGLGKKLSVDVPAITPITQKYYKIRFTDFNSLPVDYITIMAYDYQYDYGVGTPVAPFDFIEQSIITAKSQITNHSRIAVGINSYGYVGFSGQYTMKLLTLIEANTKYPNVRFNRDVSSGELIGITGNEYVVKSDSTTLNQKIALVKKNGIANISIWHLGGNAIPTVY